MPLPKEYYTNARLNKRLRTLEQRIAELEKALAAAHSTQKKREDSKKNA